VDPITWTYRFIFSGDSEETLTVSLDPKDFSLIAEPNGDLPDWAKLDVHQCDHCPLAVDTHPGCPLAEALVRPISIFSNILSYQTITLEVVSPERTVRQEVPAQNAVGSLMGLIMATSGCPHTVFFKPMARFHLPLSSQPETLYRAASMYMLAQYYRNQNGQDSDLTFEGLTKIYEDMEILNRSMAKRVRQAIEADAAVNAVVVLDFFAKNWAFSIHDQMIEMKPLFQAYLDDMGEPS
jgi:hypothetical protein